MNFEAATLNFAIVAESLALCLEMVRYVDLRMTNGSKVQKTLQYFLLHYLQEYNKIWNITKSNKSKLWKFIKKWLANIRPSPIKPFVFRLPWNNSKYWWVTMAKNLDQTYWLHEKGHTVWPEPIWIKVSGWWQIPPQHQSTYLPKRTRICINWNPPFQT